MNQQAEIRVRYELHGELITAEGRRFQFGKLDRSLTGWWRITLVNLRRRQWQAVRRNLTSDLAKTILRR